jgi:7-cyano-7-deazaguanine synthase
MRKSAVLLLSGGLDSTTLLAHAIAEGFDVWAMTFRYGQRHAGEIEAARRIASAYAVRGHVVVDIDLRTFGGSALTSDIDVPKDRPLERAPYEIPITYVPARNTIFLSFALAWAEVLGAGDIFIGVNAFDYSGYPDCRPEYIAAFERMANLATRGGVEGTNLIRIRTPLIDFTKADIIRRGLELGVDYAPTLSCYDPAPDGSACGHCDACQLRLKGFAEAGVVDPARYVHG